MAEAGQQWLLFWGHFHPMLVHLPIGMFFIAGIIYFFPKQDAAVAARILIWTSGFSFLSASMGWGLAQSGEYEPDTLQIHQWLGISTCFLSAYLAYLVRKSPDGKFTKALWIIGFLCLSITGHYGGNLTHGSDYLTAGLPDSARKMLGMAPIQKTEDAEGGPKISNLQEALVYAQIVKPILDQKCTSCHNGEKQKGKLRLDSPEFIGKGGKHGQIISAGMPLESELIKRLLLDPSDEHHMPPKGKTPLTDNEIALLHWWVQHGADFKKKVADLPVDEKIKPALASLTAGEKSQESAVFSISVDPADEADLERLRKHGLLANPVANDQAFIEVNAVNAPQISAKELADLNKVQSQIMRLKLGNTQIRGDVMKLISGMPHLVQLDLNHTKIGDQDLQNLTNLAYLESLNLVGTDIGDAGISSLAKIKSLKRVYLWQSKVSEKGILQLKKMRPDLAVQLGFKGRWPLEVDSAQIKAAE